MITKTRIVQYLLANKCAATDSPLIVRYSLFAAV